MGPGGVRAGTTKRLRATGGRHVAADGEWTRRRIDGPEVARKLSRDLAIPVYDAQVTGYPQRMRDWSARQKDNRLR